MADNQGRTIQNVGDLKQAIQSLPDDTKLASSASSDPSMGLNFQQSQDRVILSEPQDQGRQQT